MISSKLRIYILPRLLIALLILLSISAIHTNVQAAPTLKRIDLSEGSVTLSEITDIPRAHAINQDRVIIVGRNIQIRDLSGLVISTLPAITSKELYSDVKKFKNGFLVVGVIESVTSSVLNTEVGVINPDSVSVTGEAGSTNGLTRLVLRELSYEGEVLRNIFFENEFPILARSLLISQDRAIVVGERANAIGIEGFVAEFNIAQENLVDTAQVRVASIGKVSTKIFAASSPKILYGLSREKIGESTAQSFQDGVIIFLSNNLQVSRVVRSYQRNTSRAWSGVNKSNLAVGTLLEGSKSTVTITKFNKSAKPQWSIRAPGASNPVISEQVVGLIGKGSILQLPAIKVQSAFFLVFDNKGRVKSAVNTPAQRIRSIADGYALIQLRSGAYQLIPLPNTK